MSRMISYLDEISNLRIINIYNIGIYPWSVTKEPRSAEKYGVKGVTDEKIIRDNICDKRGYFGLDARE